jgi:hypothetical protein
VTLGLVVDASFFRHLAEGGKSGRLTAAEVATAVEDSSPADESDPVQRSYLVGIATSEGEQPVEVMEEGFFRAFADEALSSVEHLDFQLLVAYQSA